MPYERSEYPSFSWSHSRRATFQECPRKYFYQYYGSHNGWEETASESARLAYRLKNLTSLPLEIGAAVHEAASTAIHLARSGAPMPSADDLYRSALNRMNKAWVESSNRPEWERSPKWRRMFHEFYYDTGIGEDKIADSRDRMQTCLTNLLNSTSFREAVSAPFIEVKNVEEFVTFYVDDTPIHAVPDLVYRKGDDSWTVVDWKSGNRHSDDTEQALIYALYVRELHDVRGPDISVRIERLVHGTAEDHTFTQDDLDGCIDTIRDSISAMKTYLRDADLNAPVEKTGFPLRSDTSTCKFCNFYELDRDEIASRQTGPF
jgi:hypothetical protein